LNSLFWSVGGWQRQLAVISLRQPSVYDQLFNISRTGRLSAKAGGL
jgi:hypothetical protein